MEQTQEALTTLFYDGGNEWISLELGTWATRADDYGGVFPGAISLHLFVWINLGPLLYHFADVYGQEDEMSIELSLEDVKSVAVSYGFEFEKESTIETTYTTNPRSMMQNRYFAAFWTMRKKSGIEKLHVL
ncbi:hypothetical protein LR48_Vigan09g002800 [Vigna angularis]|uniref:Uncharacterized protein n=1 Tax=Phaseolus angularis TaxID=3914 RepID=A0A0L9V9Q2_PHAAN|nr:hypothetical protein LR48_Vigan09g002800 [Vigna angularis]